MPIYAYRCSACGHAQDVLQKMSDAPLSVCPSCGESAYTKQVTAAGFQLKGSGWYVTDFRNGSTASTSSVNAKPKTVESNDTTAASSSSTAESSTPSASSADKAPVSTT